MFYIQRNLAYKGLFIFMKQQLMITGREAIYLPTGIGVIMRIAGYLGSK